MPKTDQVHVVEVDAKTIYICAKVIDVGFYPRQILGGSVAQLGKYAKCYGDGIILNIDLDTGQILNWETPVVKAIKKARRLVDLLLPEEKDD